MDEWCMPRSNPKPIPRGVQRQQSEVTLESMGYVLCWILEEAYSDGGTHASLLLHVSTRPWCGNRSRQRSWILRPLPALKAGPDRRRQGKAL